MIKSILVTLCVLAATPLVQAQSFETCADLNEDNSLSVSDLVYWFDVFSGIRALPAGKGDIDFRQGYSLGDYRYFAGYLFRGYPQGGCPPFADYEMQTTNDSIIFPMVSIPAGDGSVSSPIAFINHSDVTDILVPFMVTGLNSSITLDSVTSPFDQRSDFITVMNVDGDRGVFLFTALQGSLPPGRRVIARVHFSHQASAGGSLLVSDDDPGLPVRLSYVFGDPDSFEYDDLDVGIPTMVVSANIPFEIPSMSATPDTIEFSYTDGDPDPLPQFVTVTSDGGSFDWAVQATSRYTVSPREGLSGEAISVQPRASTFNYGTTYNDLEIRSTSTINPSVVVTLKMHVRPAYAANDADCDGDFDLTDLVILVNWLYRNGTEPCDPFSADP